MNIRGETASDYPAIAQVNRLAFGRDNEAQLVARLRQSEQFVPQLSLVAELDTGLVGHILFTSVELVGEQRLSVLALAPVAVRPEFQGQGVGSALVRAGLAVAEARAEALVIVLGHPQFYARFGFEPSVRYGIQSPFPVPEAVFRVKPLSGYQPWYQGRVSYPAAFNEV